MHASGIYRSLLNNRPDLTGRRTEHPLSHGPRATGLGSWALLLSCQRSIAMAERAFWSKEPNKQQSAAYQVS